MGPTVPFFPIDGGQHRQSCSLLPPSLIFHRRFPILHRRQHVCHPPPSPQRRPPNHPRLRSHPSRRRLPEQRDVPGRRRPASWMCSASTSIPRRRCALRGAPPRRRCALREAPAAPVAPIQFRGWGQSPAARPMRELVGDVGAESQRPPTASMSDFKRRQSNSRRRRRRL
jgi:hypothetical protein